MSARLVRGAALATAAMTVLASCAQKPEGPVARPAADTPQAVAATLQMADIPAGHFIMGTKAEVGFQNGFPPHPVNVPAFKLDRYDITFDEYDAFARATGRDLPEDEGWGRGERPVIHVSWRDAQAFIAWLNAGTGRHFRLASESEWEYAARAGTTTLYYWGDNPDPNYANTQTNQGRDHFEYTAPVGSFPANPFGLYDMAGNVWQLTEDCRHPTYDGAPADGSAWVSGDCDSRTARGGSWGSISRGMQVAASAAAGEQFDGMDLGFRVAESE
jgi:formylglycine-generating enzyme required for sulfatase activity